MTEPTTTPTDTASLVVSYLWARRGQALVAELRIAPQFAARPDVPAAAAHLTATGWVDMVHEELPAIRLTPEAIAALERHVNFGTPLPERIERAADRAARVQEAQAGASVEMVQLLREMRAEQAENRRLMIELAKAKGLPGPAPAAQIDVGCVCGSLYYPGLTDGTCGRCQKARAR